MPTSLPITVYVKDKCVQCHATTKKLDQLGISYSVINTDESPEAVEKLIALGFLQAPVVIPGFQLGVEWEPFSGYRPDLLTKLAA